MNRHPRRRRVRLADAASALVRLIRRPSGRHVADSLAGAAWTPTTPVPAPVPVQLRQPRIAPYILTRADKVRAAYDAIELEFARRLDAAVLESRLNWSMSHA